MFVRRLSSAVLATLVLAAGLASSPVFAADNPATEDAVLDCVVNPAVSTGRRSGLAAAAPGEPVAVVASVSFNEGTVYQDIITRPDGSTYVASYLLLAELGGLSLDPSTAEVTLDGQAVDTTTGTEPDPDAAVIDTSVVGEIRVYMPGDTAAILASPSGHGVHSMSTPVGGATFGLAAVATVPVDAVAGDVFDLVRCEAGFSTGPSNRSLRSKPVSVAVAEPILSAEKTVAAPFASPGGSVNWILTVANDLEDGTGQPTNRAHDVTITDGPLPAELTPLDTTGAVMTASGETNGGGVWDNVTRMVTWSIPVIEPGETERIEFATAVDQSLDPTLSIQLDNTASVTALSVPGAVAPGKFYGPLADDASVVVGLTSPTITTTGNVDEVSRGGYVSWTLEIVIPAHAADIHNFTIYDEMGAGFIPDGEVEFANCVNCLPTDGAGGVEVLSEYDGLGIGRVGIYVESLEANAQERTFTMNVTTRVNPNGDYDSGTEIAVDDVLTNTGFVAYNMIDRAGGVLPNLSRLPAFDASASASDTVSIGVPDLRIEKELVGDIDDSAHWELRIYNDSDVDAVDVVLEDSTTGGHRESGYDSQDADLDYLNYEPFTFRIDRVPGQGLVTVDLETRSERVVVEDAADPTTGIEISNTLRVVDFTDDGGFDYANAVSAAIPVATDTGISGVPWIQLEKRALSGQDGYAASGADLFYEIVATNVGTATARDVEIRDEHEPTYYLGIFDAPNGGYDDGSGAAEFFLGDIAAGDSITLTYQLYANNPGSGYFTGIADNTAQARWRDAHYSSFAETAENDVVDYLSDPASAQLTIYDVGLVVEVTPDTDDNAVIIEGQTGQYTIRVTNPNPVAVTDLVVQDWLPETLTYAAAEISVVNGSPVNVDESQNTPGHNYVEWTIERLDANAILTIVVTVDQSGFPRDFTLKNEAIASLSDPYFEVRDDGVLEFVPDIASPSALKTVSPEAAAPGEDVVYTVAFTLHQNSVDVYDINYVDWVPDGIQLDGVLTTTCISDPIDCGPTPDFAQNVDIYGNGAASYAWWFGDRVANTPPATWVVTYAAHVDTEFSGSGIPADGVTVQDGLGKEPFVNRVRSYYSLNFNYNTAAWDNYGTSFPETGQALPSWAFEYRGVAASAALDVISPFIEVTKDAPGLELFEWQDGYSQVTRESYGVDLETTVSFALSVCNSGSATAYDITFTDDMSEGRMDNVTNFAYSLGTTIIDPWEISDPATTFFIEEIPAGECVTITYDGDTPPSANLIPGGRFQYHPGDAHLIENAVINGATYQGVETLGPDDIVYDGLTTDSVEVWVVTPFPGVGARCIEPFSAGQQYSVDIELTNGRTGWITPDDYDFLNIGNLYDSVFEIIWPAEFGTPDQISGYGTQFDPINPGNSVVLTPDSSVVNGDGDTVLTFDLGTFTHGSDGTYNGWPQARISFYGTSVSDWVAERSLDSRFWGTDISGSPDRGSFSGNSFEYEATSGGLCGGIGLSKWPKRSNGSNSERFAYRPGESFDWHGSWNISIFDTYFGSNSSVSDIIPEETIYVPNTATFDVQLVNDGPSTTLTAGDEITETVTSTPFGDEYTWSGFPEHVSVSYSIPVTVDPDAEANGRVGQDIYNDIEFDDPDFEYDWSTCGSHDSLLCDQAQILILDPSDPVVTKSVDDESVTNWGADRLWTISIEIPADSYFENFSMVDTLDFYSWNGGDADQSFVYQSAECVSGCPGDGGAFDINPVAMPDTFASGPDTRQLGWWFGDIEEHTEPRTVEMTYITTSQNFEEWGTPGNYYSTQPFENEVYFQYAYDPIHDDWDVDPDQVGTGWTWDVEAACWASGNCYRGLTERAAMSLGTPRISAQKDCTPLDPEAESAVFTVPGVANVVCTIVVENTGDAAGYGLTMLDTPNPTAYIEGQNDDDGYFNEGVDASWELLGFASDTAEQPSSPWDGVSVAWELDDSDELAPGDTRTFTLDYRVSPTDPLPDGTLTFEAENSAFVTIQDRFDSPIPIDTATDDAEVQVVIPQIFVGKSIDVRSIIEYFFEEEDLTRFMYESGLTREEVLEVARADQFSGDQAFSDTSEVGNGEFFGALPANWLISVFTGDPGDINLLTVVDSLPYGHDYVPGSARLVVPKDGVFTDSNQYPTEDDFDFIPLTSEPTPSGTQDLTCASAFSGEANLSGVDLTWTFTPDGAGTSDALWDPDENFMDIVEYESYNFDNGNGGGWQDSIQIYYETVPNATFADCSIGRLAALHNRAVGTAFNDDGTQLSKTSYAGLTRPDLIELSNSPENGVVLDDTVGYISTRVSNWFPQQTDDNDDDFATWDPEETGGSFGDISITNVVTDHGLFDPALPPELWADVPSTLIDQFPSTRLIDGVDYDWSYVRRDADTVEFSFFLYTLRAGTQSLDVAGPDNPFMLDPAPTRIDIPLAVPEGTVDGTTFQSLASLEFGPWFPDRSEDGGGMIYAEVLEILDDPAELTVVNPSHPPTPFKRLSQELPPGELGETDVAIGETVTFDVIVELPASEVWFDLQYVDTLPEEMDFHSYGTPECYLYVEAIDDFTLCNISVDTITPVANADGTTSLGWWFGDFGSADQTRFVNLVYSATVRNEQDLAATLVNVVDGSSNDRNLVVGRPSGFAPTGTYEAAQARLEMNVQEPELVVNKTATASAAPTGAGATIDYTVTITNNGSASAFDIPVVDAPNGAVLNVRPTGPSTGYATKGWSAPSPTIEWFVPELGGGESVVLTYRGEVSPTYVGDGLAVAHNRVEVGPYGSQPEVFAERRTYPRLTDEADVPLDAPALTVSKELAACDGSPQVGSSEFTWCLRLQNVGTQQANNVVVSDSLPVDWAYQPGSSMVDGAILAPDSVSGNPEVVVWNLGDVAADGDVIEIEYVSVPGGRANAWSTNRVRVQSDYDNGETAAPGALGYTAYAQDVARILAVGLEISKTPDELLLERDGTDQAIEWTVLVSNTTTGDLDDVLVADTATAPLTIDAIAADPTCADFQDLGGGSATVDLAAGTSCEITVFTTLPASAPSGIYRNHVEASHDDTPTVANIGLVDAWAAATVGNLVWADLDNDGLQDASEPGVQGATVRLIGTDRWGNAIDTSTVTGADGSWSIEVPGGEYQIAVSALPAGDVITLQGQGANTALDSDIDAASGMSAIFTLVDGETNNDLDAGVATPRADLAITKTASADAIAVGEAVEWTLVVDSLGPEDMAAEITVVDNVPDAFAIEAVPEGCEVSGQLVTCVLPDGLAAGDSATFTITTTALRVGEYTNSVIAEAVQSEVTLDNNVDTADVAVDDGSAKPQGSQPSPGDSTPSAGQLPTPNIAYTGAEIAGLTAAGLFLLFLGAGLVVLTRRRKDDDLNPKPVA